jgi:predicted outer membrane repeat protein
LFKMKHPPHDPFLRPLVAVCALGGLLALVAVSEASGRVWRVRADGTGDRPTLLLSLDEAAAGDTILIGPGTYTGAYLIEDKHLTLIGEAGAAATVLDGGATPGNRILTFVQSGYAVVIQGLTFRNGYAAGGFPAGDGGAVAGFCSPLVIRDCVFENNWAILRGGAVYCVVNFVPGVCSPTVRPPVPGLSLVRCRFDDNKGFGEGGAVYADDTYTSIQGSTFSRNYAVNGGAVEILNLGMWMLDCRFVNNSADKTGGAFRATGIQWLIFTGVHFEGNTAPDRGGAMEVRNASGPTNLTACAFIDNRTTESYGLGGGLFLFAADVLAERVLWQGNAAGAEGGGVFLEQVERASFRRVTWVGNAAPRAAAVGFEDNGTGAGLTEIWNSLVLDDVARAVDCRTDATVAVCNVGAPGAGACFPFVRRQLVEPCPDDPWALCALPETECGPAGHTERICPPELCATPVRATSWGLLKARAR